MTPNPAAIVSRILALGLIWAPLGCNRGKEPAAAAAQAPATTPAVAGADIPVVTNFGVPECDAYVEKYMSCLDGKVSPEAKQRLLEAFEMNRNKWRAMSTMRESASALAVVCRAATQKAKEELSVDYGCEF